MKKKESQQMYHRTFCLPIRSIFLWYMLLPSFFPLSDPSFVCELCLRMSGQSYIYICRLSPFSSGERMLSSRHFCVCLSIFSVSFFFFFFLHIQLFSSWAKKKNARELSSINKKEHFSREVCVWLILRFFMLLFAIDLRQFFFVVVVVHKIKKKYWKKMETH